MLQPFGDVLELLSETEPLRAFGDFEQGERIRQCAETAPVGLFGQTGQDVRERHGTPLQVVPQRIQHRVELSGEAFY